MYLLSFLVYMRRGVLVDLLNDSGEELSENDAENDDNGIPMDFGSPGGRTTRGV
jgi:hypothetical protein